MSKELARDLISAGVHFGHAASKWDPKMKPFLFCKRNKIHIIDVKETLKGLLIAKKLLADVVSSGKDVVFVGTKRQAKKAVEETSAECGMHYVSERWLGGMLTNFQTVRSRLKRLEELEGMQESGKIAAESKKQGSRLKREMRKIKTNLEGIRKMNRLPGAVIVVDTKKEYLALREARKLSITTVGIIDTDSNPDEVDVAIPANDDSLKAIEIILGELAKAVAYGKTVAKSAPAAGRPTARVKSKRRALASATEEQAVATEPGTSAEPVAVQPVQQNSTPEEPTAKPVAVQPVQQSGTPEEPAADVQPVQQSSTPKEPAADVQPTQESKTPVEPAEEPKA